MCPSYHNKHKQHKFRKNSRSRQHQSFGGNEASMLLSKIRRDKRFVKYFEKNIKMFLEETYGLTYSVEFKKYSVGLRHHIETFVQQHSEQIERWIRKKQKDKEFKTYTQAELKELLGELYYTLKKDVK